MLYHHGSHQGLLKSPTKPAPAGRRIDAIFVPTARPPAYLTEVAELAMALGCTLVTMHSGRWTTATRATARLCDDLRLKALDLIAIDVPASSGLRLPGWETSAKLAGTIFARRTDLSVKRNLALMLCHLVGWSRILFLDDDITGLNPDDVLDASGLLDDYNAVGLRIGGFPDHSVVCHAFREAGGKQQAFIGGGALAIAVDRCDSFFPDIYNDDWFFLLDGNGSLQPTAAAGGVIQCPYDPFRTPERARAEEFGDMLAEGIYWLLDQGKTIADADTNHWHSYKEIRRKFINDVLGMVQAETAETAKEAAEKERKIAALKGSLGRLQLIEPALCDGYLRAWSADRQRWSEHVFQLDGGMQRDRALNMLSSQGSPKLTYKVSQPILAEAWQ